MTITCSRREHDEPLDALKERLGYEHARGAQRDAGRIAFLDGLLFKLKDMQAALGPPRRGAMLSLDVHAREGQDIVEKNGSYLPLTAAVVRDQLRKLD